MLYKMNVIKENNFLIQNKTLENYFERKKFVKTIWRNSVSIKILTLNTKSYQKVQEQPEILSKMLILEHNELS